jgi:diaminopimelate decarboxylase
MTTSEFRRIGGELHCEGTPLETLAECFGTPLYVYSERSIQKKFEQFDKSFEGSDHLICFAVKANSNRAILRSLADMGAGADVVSGGEIYRAERAGIDPARMVYSGVGKSVAEMEQALKAEILMFNIESFSELKVLDEVAGRVGKRARISLRINPDVDPRTHPYVSTGLKTSKFGIRFESVLEGYERARELRNIDVVGVDCHIGSQLSSIDPFVEAVTRVREVASTLRDRGFDIRYLDLGGGLGITYDRESPPPIEEFGSAMRAVLEGERAKIIVEPGRSIVGNAGALLTRVLYTKKSEGKRFAIVDAGMNDLMRPSIYGSFHAIEQVVEKGREPEITDVVGPVCESGDFLAKNREMPALRAGDLIAVMSAGAYCFSMASTYNSRPLAAEVMVKGDRHALVRKRGSYEDLVRGERDPEFS